MLMEPSEAQMRAEVSASISVPFRECISCVLMTLLARYLCLGIMNSTYMRNCSFHFWSGIVRAIINVGLGLVTCGSFLH